ncbi:MAG: SLBB domain-containing protein [Chloroherpetonaceae bacterium]|nr:SLBB domain-containing protein [Chthonomonadaceae bacterium]MDW8208692.1 SLBB domain-containing protein [Chloroherpetonaceae bacterium]
MRQFHTIRSLVTTRCAARVIAAAMVALGVVCGIPAPAQEDVPAVVTTDSDYVVGVDDVLVITAPGHDEINQTVLVLPDGTIRVSGIPEKIRAAGLTLDQVRASVYKGLERLYNNLEISVALKEVNSRMVTILGTRNPGRFPLRKGMRVSGLIAAGAGLQTKTKLVSGTLIRGLKTIKLDMPKIVGMEPDLEADLLLEPNDTVILDYKEEAPPPMFSVLGAVQKGGTFPMPLDGTPVSLARAVADAGGRTPTAALQRVKLLRKGQTIPLNLYPLLVEGKANAEGGNMMMQDGDVLIIPELDIKYLVLGQVNKPGTIYIPESRSVTVQQALAEGGGPTQYADLRRAVVIRIVDGKKVSIKVNLDDSLKKPDKVNEIIMQDGDVLYIPPKGRGLQISDITNPLWVLSMFGLRLF